MIRRLGLGLVLPVAMVVSWLPFAQSAAAASPNVVISQIYGGGGNTGAQLGNDFVELFNRGAATVSLAGWSIQYASASGTGTFGSAAQFITPLAGSIAPGQYVLVQEASGGAVGAALPAPDVTDATPINMAAVGGKIALVNTTTPLGCNGSAASPCSATALASIVDLVGYDGANFFEGAGPAPTLSNTTAAFRAGGGCLDTDSNSADFVAAPPAPRNAASPAGNCNDAAPSVTATVPASGASGVAVDASISVTFSEPVNVAGTWFRVVCGTSGGHAATATGGPTTFAIDPGTDFANAETCTVTVLAADVADQDLLDPPDNMASDYVFAFSTVAPTRRIHEIQGAAHISPFKDQLVSGVPGIVTAKRTNGFYLQDPEPDSSDATSEGIFVFTGSAPTAVTVGDAVTVGGLVQEFRPGGVSSANLTVTEIASPSVVVVSHGNPLPAATTIGTGGRLPPAAVIEDDATGSVEASGAFDPANDGIDFYESLEGMLVRVNDPVIVGPTNSFNEIPVLADGGAGAGPRTARGGIRYGSYADPNPERIIVDDEILKAAGLGPFPTGISVGDRFAGSLVGVVDYSFGNFMTELTALPTLIAAGTAAETTRAPGLTDLTVATFNVQNLAAGDPDTKFGALAGLIVNNLRSPRIIAVEEVQDNTGAADDGVVAADLTIARLVHAIESAGGPTYTARAIDPVNDQDGGQPGGNIRQIFLFQDGDGLSFVDRPGGTSTTATTVVASADGSPRLSFSPGRVDPANPAWSSSRKPLAGEFQYYDRHLFVIANHFNSKLGDDPLFGRFQPPARSSDARRLQQATIVADFARTILALDPDADIVVLGDLNDFEFSPPLVTLKDAALADLIETLPAAERYTYDFEGNSETLDHILVSTSLAPASELDVVHVNAEFDARTRASDHDPQVVIIKDQTAPTIVAHLPPANANGWYGGPTGPTVTFTCDDNIPVGLVCPHALTLGEGADQSVSGTATDGAGNEATIVMSGLDVDLTRPTIAFSGNNGSYTVDQTVAITCTAMDALSRVDPAHTTCPGASGPAYVFALGMHTLSATATDRAGNVATASTTFAVGASEADLCVLARRFATKDGVAGSLCAKLESAADARDRGNMRVERSILNAFANEVEAQRAKAISPADATVLLTLAGQI